MFPLCPPIALCSWLDAFCYPGVCPDDSTSCNCSEGFQGPNCLNSKLIYHQLVQTSPLSPLLLPSLPPSSLTLPPSSLPPSSLRPPPSLLPPPSFLLPPPSHLSPSLPSVTVSPMLETCSLTLRGMDGREIFSTCFPPTNTSTPPPTFTNVPPSELEANWNSVYPGPSSPPSFPAYVSSFSVGVAISEIRATVYRAASKTDCHEYNVLPFLSRIIRTGPSPQIQHRLLP